MHLEIGVGTGKAGRPWVAEPSRPVQCTHGEAKSVRLICLAPAHCTRRGGPRRMDISNVRHAILLVDALRGGRAKESEVARPTTLHATPACTDKTACVPYRTKQLKWSTNLNQIRYTGSWCETTSVVLISRHKHFQTSMFSRLQMSQKRAVGQSDRLLACLFRWDSSTP